MTERPVPIIEETDAPEVVRARPCGVYRLFSAAVTLLYVGSGHEPRVRLNDHRRTKEWWPEVARTTVAWYANPEHAKIAEAEAVRDEVPVHNKYRWRYRPFAASVPPWPTVADALSAARALQALPPAEREHGERLVTLAVTRALNGVWAEAVADALDGYAPTSRDQVARQVGVGPSDAAEAVRTWNARGRPDPFAGFQPSARTEGGLEASVAELWPMPPRERAYAAPRLAVQVPLLLHSCAVAA